jgi:protein-arginine kinase activator protein McsA
MKTLKEAINDLQAFFECDIWTKFYPEIKVKNKIWIRDDKFKSKREFEQYLQEHFDVLRDEIKYLKENSK